MKKYLILAQGEYSDYSVFFIEKDERLTNEEHLILLSVDESYSKPDIVGEFEGEFVGEPNIRLEPIKKVAENQINRLVCCYSYREVKTILDREYTRDELLEIAKKNDNSAPDYWEGKIDEVYAEYKEALKIYQKLV